ncbi:MAG TPA: glycerate kinase [Anaerolineales bacterium]|nr:glycerate kinase [Anaerolineales bacterium]
MDVTRFATHSLKDPRILRVLSAALEAVDPFDVVQKELPEFERPVFGLGIGKAAIPMMDALAAQVPLAGGLAVTKFAPRGTFRRYTVIEGGHPVPDARSLYAGQEVLKFVSSLNEDDILICLISGGGSALVTAPDERISLEDLRSFTSLMLSCGARIDEINTIRRQLDRIKGGGLARAKKAKIISLILSDVIGNPLEAIASGPTVSDPTTSADALAILDKYFATESPRYRDSDIINSVTEFLSGSEKIQPQDFDWSRIQNIIIGDNRLAAVAAMQQAQHDGFHSDVLTNELQGEAREVGVRLARQLKEEVSNRSHPFCLVTGGETTVTIKGDGKGGRNQELALAAVEELRDLQNAMLISLATDGDDGPTGAAGAVVTGESAQRAESLGLSAAEYLSRNDAYPFFEALGDLLKTGPTGTNVNDLIFLIGGVV